MKKREKETGEGEREGGKEKEKKGGKKNMEERPNLEFPCVSVYITVWLLPERWMSTRKKMTYES